MVQRREDRTVVGAPHAVADVLEDEPEAEQQQERGERRFVGYRHESDHAPVGRDAQQEKDGHRQHRRDQGIDGQPLGDLHGDSTPPAS